MKRHNGSVKQSQDQALAAIHSALEARYGSYHRARERVEEIAARLDAIGKEASEEDDCALAVLIACAETFAAQASFLPPRIHAALGNYASVVFLLAAEAEGRVFTVR